MPKESLRIRGTVKSQIATPLDRFEIVQRFLFSVTLAATWLVDITCNSAFADKPNVIVILTEDMQGCLKIFLKSLVFCGQRQAKNLNAISEIRAN